MKIFSTILSLFVFAFLFGMNSVEAKVTRYVTGNPADVQPTLHGPSLDLGGGSADVDQAFQAMFDEVRGCTSCDTKLDVVILGATVLMDTTIIFLQ